jgi:hypothetical protein
MNRDILSQPIELIVFQTYNNDLFVYFDLNIFFSIETKLYSNFLLLLDLLLFLTRMYLIDYILSNLLK